VLPPLICRVGRVGGDVRFAIHPIAGRVLLAESGVPYGKHVEREDTNRKFADTDVALLVGANGVLNLAVRTNAKSPIITIRIALKSRRGAGFAGVENDLFADTRTSMLFGDAKQSLVMPGPALRRRTPGISARK
jgi:H+-translocating NAD(P) transhydrogenase subunit beta